MDLNISNDNDLNQKTEKSIKCTVWSSETIGQVLTDSGFKPFQSTVNDALRPRQCSIYRIHFHQKNVRWGPKERAEFVTYIFIVCAM